MPERESGATYSRLVFFEIRTVNMFVGCSKERKGPDTVRPKAGAGVDSMPKGGEAEEGAFI